MDNSIFLKDKPSQSQIFELLGRAVYLCNVIELRLRWMHKHCGGIWTGKTPQELLESLKKAIEKQKGDKSPLGPIGVEMLETIYTPRCNKELENAEKQGLFAFNFDYKIEWKGRLRHAKTKFKNFVDVRNTLVHYVARDYDLATPETCQKAYADLKKKCEIIKDTFEFFNVDYERMNKMMMTFRDNVVKVLQNTRASSSENKAKKVVAD